MTSWGDVMYKYLDFQLNIYLWGRKQNKSLELLLILNKIYEILIIKGKEIYTKIEY